MSANTFADQMAAGEPRDHRSSLGSVSAGDSPKGDEWEAVVQQLVSTLRFGVVQITVHESRVVQVERTEKVRFAQPAASKPNR